MHLNESADIHHQCFNYHVCHHCLTKCGSAIILNDHINKSGIKYKKNNNDSANEVSKRCMLSAQLYIHSYNIFG